MHECFAAAGAPLAGVYLPHHPILAWRLPRRLRLRQAGPGMLLQAAKELQLDLARSILFGDRNSDLVAARLAGVPHRSCSVSTRADPRDDEDQR